jgi:DeoR/GlpR family transcriptional regulator of sugar metabolism
MNRPDVLAASKRRDSIVGFLRQKKEPAIIQDFVSFLRESARLIRDDLRYLERLGTVRKRAHKGTCRNWGRDHNSRYCSWELTR